MKSLLLILTILITTGCTGAKEIQNQTYVTAIGLDYTKGYYTVYMQGLNFANIAKSESGAALQQTPPILIGEAKGKSIQAAFSSLAQRTALPLYYGHVDTFLLNQGVIESNLRSVIEFIGQNPFLRYNCWLYGTKNDIKNIFLGESFFNYPSLYTILHSPLTLMANNYVIPIEKYNRFISKYYDPVGSYVIPSIDIKDENFLNNKKPKKVAALTGGFVIAHKQYKGFASKQELSGLKWFSDKASNIPLSLFKEKVSVIVLEPDGSIKVSNGPKPAYDLKVKAHAMITQNEENLDVKKIEKEIAKKIKNQILQTINKSEELRADLLNMSERPYRFHYGRWDLETINTIDKSLIKHIDVNVYMDETIKYKR